MTEEKGSKRNKQKRARKFVDIPEDPDFVPIPESNQSLPESEKIESET